jgi:hypothetical protein
VTTMFGLSIFTHFCCSGDVDAEPSRNRYRHTSNQKVSVMMLIMRVVMTIRTGRCTPHSAARFARVPATCLAQHHPSPEIARELPYFLWKWHRLIEIGQELTKDISSCHTSCSPHHFSSIVSLSSGVAIAPAKDLSHRSVRAFTCSLSTTLA